ncbi:MAG: hypothetical protein ABJM43_02165 [Paracoccaceae bacterium]
MAKLGYKAVMTVGGPLMGWATYQFAGPWWVYLIALAVFLVGLISFSVDNEPDRSGYENRADDGRGSAADHDGADF